MKSLILFGLMSAALALAVFLSQLASQSKRESVVIGWSNSLIWEALDQPDAFEFSAISVHEEEASPDLWTAIGRLTLRDPEGRPILRGYTALIQKVCSKEGERVCWQLVELTVAGEPLVREGAPVAGPDNDGGQDGAEVQSPAADSEETARPSEVPAEGPGLGRESEPPAGEVAAQEGASPVPVPDTGVAADPAAKEEVRQLASPAPENGQSASPGSEAPSGQPTSAAPAASHPPIPRRRP